MTISTFQRISKAYLTVGKTFGSWVSPIFTGILVIVLRLVVSLGRLLDRVFFPRAFKTGITNPVLVVGNPRSGTTFFQRYLVKNAIGIGSQLWQLLYSSILLQKIIRPVLPLLEKVSPTRHHSTAAHKTSLQSVETDDAGIFFRFLDGFFLYGFILSWAEEDLFHWVDPGQRDTSKRDFDWLESIWLRNQYQAGSSRTVGKLFSISANLPRFLERFPGAKILYIIRDPLAVIPSGLSLVTGVLDKRFGFWSQPPEIRQRFINRLYKALTDLLLRFHSDWTEGRIDKNNVMIIHYDRIMGEFDKLMPEVLDFINHSSSEELRIDIKTTAENQRNFQSGHKYDLKKFGLSAEKIRKDCAAIYTTFLNSEN